MKMFTLAVGIIAATCIAGVYLGLALQDVAAPLFVLLK